MGLFKIIFLLQLLIILLYVIIKSIFDVLEEEELRKARTRSNPFETIRGAFFLNRAAMKMANLDAVFDFMFTDPRNEDGVSINKVNIWFL